MESAALRCGAMSSNMKNPYAIRGQISNNYYVYSHLFSAEHAESVETGEKKNALIDNLHILLQRNQLFLEVNDHLFSI